MVLEEARKRFLCCTASTTNLQDAKRNATWRGAFDEEPFGFVLEGTHYEVHHKGFKRGKLNGTTVKVDVLTILVLNPRGDATIYADGVEVIPCE